MKRQKINYYSDELNDDFAGFRKNTKTITAGYPYEHRHPIWFIFRFIVYRLFVTPFAFFYCKMAFRTKIHNKKVIKEHRKEGFFLYGNHTLIPADGFIPSLILSAKENYFLVHPDNVSQKGTEQIMLMLGCLPIPTELKGMKPFLHAISKRNKAHACITVYPEAHVWPFYTKIRPFPSTSFKFPVKHNSPSYCFTTCFKKRKFRKKPRIEVYVDGPFYANEELSSKERVEDLRNQIYHTMCKQSKNSTYEYIKYIKYTEEHYD